MVHRRGPATVREVDLSGKDVIERLLLVVHACPEGALLRKRSGKPDRSCDDALCGQTARARTCPFCKRLSCMAALLSTYGWHKIARTGHKPRSNRRSRGSATLGRLGA